MLAVHDFLHTLQKSGKIVDMEDALAQCAAHFASQSKLICFDELVVRDVADAMLLSRLFSVLIKSNVRLVFTSNTPPSLLYEGGWQRERFIPFIELIEKHFTVLELSGRRDYRLRNVDEINLYRWPCDEANQNKLKSDFLALCGDVSPQSLSIQVKGRAVDVPLCCMNCTGCKDHSFRNISADGQEGGKAAGSVAYFSFNDICAKPYGAIDYLALSAHFSAFFIDDVPYFAEVNRNEAKRFIILVDTLYDTRRKLVLCAAAEPSRLYRGTDHAFEFERTASRLMEIRTKAYWDEAGK